MEIDLVEKKAVVNSIEIKYMFKPATLDTDHLIIIFSGYGLNSLFTYDWSGDSQKDIPSNILWIKDEFDECPCYYLCKHRNFIIEDSIIKFIKQWLHTLSLTNNDVTLLGASKGATSALYYGIKYGFKNIISSAPQIDLGNFLERIHKVVTRNYMYDLSKNDNIEFFNRIIYKIINENNFVESNIYLIYSDIDEYQESYSEIIDILKKKCPNFSCIKVDSLLVKYHNQITDYSARLIKSILFQNAFKISPRFDNIIIGSSTIPTISKELCAMQKVHECYYEKIVYNEKSLQIFFSSFCRFNNTVASDAWLELESNTGQYYKFKLVNVTIDRINKKYFLYKHFDVADFCYKLEKGIEIDKISPSLYDFSITKTINNKNVKTKVVSLHKISIILNKDKKTFGKIIAQKNENIKLCISNSISEVEPDIFKITYRYFDRNSFLYEGLFIKYGLLCDNYSDLDFYMIFKNNEFISQIRLGKLTIDKSLLKRINSHGQFSKSSFSSIGRKKIFPKEISLKDGTYEIYISMINLTYVYSYKMAKITIENTYISNIYEYPEKEDSISSINLESQSYNDWLHRDKNQVCLKILEYINDLDNNKEFDFVKYTKIKDYLTMINNTTLLNFLNTTINSHILKVVI